MNAKERKDKADILESLQAPNAKCRVCSAPSWDFDEHNHCGYCETLKLLRVVDTFKTYDGDKDMPKYKTLLQCQECGALHTKYENN